MRVSLQDEVTLTYTLSFKRSSFCSDLKLQYITIKGWNSSGCFCKARMKVKRAGMGHTAVEEKNVENLKTSQVEEDNSLEQVLSMKGSCVCVFGMSLQWRLISILIEWL